MKSLDHRVAGLDVHRMLLVLTVLVELDDGSLSKQQRSFGSFRRDLRELVAWLQSLAVERWSWRAPASTGKASMQPWRRRASRPMRSTPTTPRTCRAARPTGFDR